MCTPQNLLGCGFLDVHERRYHLQCEAPRVCISIQSSFFIHSATLGPGFGAQEFG